MLGNFPPFTTMQELNLDWILTKIKNILRFVPDDGAVGQILRRTAHGAEWSNEQGGGGAVNSVNGQTGTVVLTASDVNAMPDNYVAPVTSVNGQTGVVSLSIPTDTSDLNNDSGFVDAAGAAAAAPVQSVNGHTGTVVLTASDVNAMPDNYVAPVTSVNGQTGVVTLSIPTDTSDLNNDSGFVDAAGAAAAAPVQSVNGQTGTVVIPNLKVLKGTFNVSSSSTGEKTGSISFDTPFTQIIGLVLSWNEKNVNGYFRGNVEYGSLTVNGFNWAANCTNAYNATWKCNWIAFGY